MENVWRNDLTACASCPALMLFLSVDNVSEWSMICCFLWKADFLRRRKFELRRAPSLMSDTEETLLSYFGEVSKFKEDADALQPTDPRRRQLLIQFQQGKLNYAHWKALYLAKLGESGDHHIRSLFNILLCRCSQFSARTD